MQTLLSIGIALLAGLLMSRAVKPFKLPAVTGYLLAGILVGPYCLGRLGIPGIGFSTMESVASLNLISEVALGFIAFSIGNEFRLSQLKKTGRQAAVIGVVQALTATLFVDLALYGLHLILGEERLPIAVVLTLGAIATATAPAATLMVVNQYKAKGPLTDLLLPIVALDDAVGLVVFAISFGVAKALSFGAFSVAAVLFNPLIEVAASLLLGSLMGYLFTFVEQFFHSNSKRLSISITFVILTVALAMLEIDLPGGELKLGFSSLLVCMMLGTVFCNVCGFSEELMARCDRWTAPLFVLFFVVSGAELDLAVFSNGAVAGIGVVYILARSLGKYLGASASAKLVRCAPNIVRYLGITLLPQAGVALGMTITVAEELGEPGRVIRSVVLFGVLIYELVGPMLTKIALTKSGDIQPKTREGRSPLPSKHPARVE